MRFGPRRCRRRGPIFLRSGVHGPRLNRPQRILGYGRGGGDRAECPIGSTPVVTVGNGAGARMLPPSAFLASIGKGA